MELLSRDYPIKDVCAIMGVSRAGFYKWKKRGRSTRALDREKLLADVRRVHGNHSTHGYRWVAAYLRINENGTACDNLVYKCFRFLGITAMTRHRVKHRPRKVKDRYPNLIFSTWDTVDRPRQVIVSDMTAFKILWMYVEVTFYFDVFTKEIVAYRCGERRGDRNQYIDGLEDVKDLLKGQTEPCVLHTDQGSVYASVAYNDIIKDTVIVRSMSRAGKPTDNPVNEALNGWIKEELIMDFRLEGCRNVGEVKELIARYVKYYNEQRPCYAIGYDTPTNYRRRFDKGEIPRKDTFSKREPSPLPKFVSKCKGKDTAKTFLSPSGGGCLSGGGGLNRPQERTPGEGNLNTFVGSSHPTHGDIPDKGILSVDCKMDRTICPLSEKEILKKL